MLREAGGGCWGSEGAEASRAQSKRHGRKAWRMRDIAHLSVETSDRLGDEGKPVERFFTVPRFGRIAKRKTDGWRLISDWGWKMGEGEGLMREIGCIWGGAW